MKKEHNETLKEIDELKKNLKLTNVNELKIQNQIFIDETNKIKKLLDKAAFKSNSDNMLNVE